MLLFYTSLINDEKDKLRFEEIYYSYHKTMYAIANGILQNKEDSEDAVQIALLNLARHMDKVPSSNEKVLSAYIYTTIRNTAYSILRKKAIVTGDFDKTIKQFSICDGRLINEMPVDGEVVGRITISEGYLYTVIWGNSEKDIRWVKIQIS